MTKGSAITPSNLRAARALSAQSIKEVALAAKISPWLIADFERGQRSSLGEHAAAVVDAMEQFGVRFEADGTISAAAPSPPALAIGAPFRWIEAQDLAAWAGTRDGQEGLPELISRLILATVGPSAQFRFPAGDSIVFPGWDGICNVATGKGNVPDGVSVWEIGAQRTDIRGKADEDFEKRSTGPTTIARGDSAFVFVTPHRWPAKFAWVHEKEAVLPPIWRKVGAIDGDDLVHWLDLCPGVSQWLANRIGKRRPGTRDLRQAFEEWSLATNPPMSAGLLLADRDEEATKLRRWLVGLPSVESVQAESIDEAVAFLGAVVEPLPTAYRLFWESRFLVAGSCEAARALIDLSAKVVVVLEEGDAGLAASLVKSGHHVFVALGSEAAQSSKVMQLPRPWRLAIERELVLMGIEHHRAQGLAKECGRSLAVLRRLMPVGVGRTPPWAAPPISSALLAAMLGGAWDAAHPVDRQVMERLSGRPYSEIETELAPWSSALDSPLRRAGSAWKLASLRDGWFLMAGHLTARYLDLLADAFLSVLSADDPGFDADPADKWNFQPGPPKLASRLLRKGLTEAMIALAVFPERAAAVHDAKRRTEAAVRALMRGADERKWWSLSNDFRGLAEASPEAFLDCLEQALDANPVPVMSVFRSDEGFLHKTEYLADLMWALELLAWSPDYLGRVAFALARLAELDPGGNWGNRPDATLKRIFLPWLPQTFAAAAERREVLDAVVARQPEVGWDLLIALAPADFASEQPSAFPRWRDFSAGDPPPTLTRDEVAENYAAVGQRLLLDAGNDPKRWAALLDRWHGFTEEWRTNAQAALGGAIATFSPEQRTEFHETLRRVIGKHEQVPQAHWSLKSDALRPLKELLRQLEPTDPTVKYAYLFGGPTFTYRGDRSWRELEEEANSRRRVAAEEILATCSTDDVNAMVGRVGQPRRLGEALALASAPDAVKDSLMERALSGPELKEFARGMLFGLLQSRGEQWLLDRFRDGIGRAEGPDVLARLALALPDGQQTWDAVDAAGTEVTRAYWQQIEDHAIPESADPAFVVDKLLAVHRGHTALAWIGGHPKLAVPASLIVSVLRHSSTMSGGHQDGDGMLQYYAVQLFERLDADPTADPLEIVGLEWIYYSLLEHSERPPKNLNDALAMQPHLFMDLIGRVYLPDGEVAPAEISEQDKNIAEQAWRVLSGWTTVPGTRVNGEIDPRALQAWVDEVRRIAQQKRLSPVTESKIGAILSAAPRTDGMPWPPEAVRQVLESSRSVDLEEGFYVAVRNRRGVTMRRSNDGGDQERDLVAMYRSDAKSAGAANVRTRALLNKIAESYQYQANEEDQGAERRDW
ncbi:XRE family transcriptional regulator [Bradyrhizobium guangdongense]|uniref:XRE family transcriptional regulator n=1 Tax=Bradyrhizobium guangdongense TaxID=1325090 RepID=A0A410UZN3_9BRAD|nr:XRE family transcriptional regulator [Bradyrhizobium guangdongense]QAU36840.1 XRE family transcriptional regulator [Bradyrhizobium guangdongense]QOZ57892.1 XRE family transcriptional regulator [Bradyrhizobium guangdongense]GGI27850.1 hypothetical protein GCM10010987_46450 [Bradyrhizobium guangdongense]